MNIELMEKIAKRKEKEEKDFVFEQPLGKGYVAKKALKGALQGAGVGAGLGAGFGGMVGFDMASGVYFGKDYADALLKARQARIAGVKKGSGVGAAIGAGIGALAHGAASASGAAKDRYFSNLPIERQRAIIREMKESGDEFNEAAKNANRPTATDKNKEDFNNASERFNKSLNDYFAAQKEGKAILKSNKFNKKASLDYDEMVKFAYEDILGGFEKSAEENDDEEAKRQEHKKKVMKRLAAAGALTAAVPAVGIAAYKYDHRPGKYHPKTIKYRKDAAKAMKGKPIEDWSDKVEIVMPGSSANPTRPILTPLLSASNPHLLSAAR